MAAISTNAIPAAAPAPAKANGHDIKTHDAKASGEDTFAAILNANAQPPAQPAASAAGNDKRGTDTDKEDAAPAAEPATSTQASAQEQEEVQPGKTPAPSKPEAKENKTANDNDPAGDLAQLAAQPNDPNAMAQAQMASAQAAAGQPLPPANDDAGEHDDTSAMDAAQSGTKAGAKSGGKPALAAPATAEDTAPANSQSPAAAAQAAVTGTNNGGSKDSNSGKDADHAVKAAVKAASADSTPKAEAPQPTQSAPPAPPVTAAATASHTLPVQTAGASHDVAAHIEVAPHTATPDVNNLAVEIATRSQSGARQFSIRLDPPELGRVDVRLSIDATGKAEAHLTADHPDTLNLLQKDSSILTQALRASGLDVSQDGLNFSLRGQNSNSGHENGNRERRANLAATRAIDAAQTASTITFTGAGNGRVDIHV